MPPRIAIVGGGLSGVATAAMLARRLPSALLTVLERADSNRDEGYGLDLDEEGQVRRGLNAAVCHSYY